MDKRHAIQTELQYRNKCHCDESPLQCTCSTTAVLCIVVAYHEFNSSRTFTRLVVTDAMSSVKKDD